MPTSKAKKIRFSGLLIKATVKKKIQGYEWNGNSKSSILESQVCYINIYSDHKHQFYYCSSVIFDLDNLRGN